VFALVDSKLQRELEMGYLATLHTTMMLTLTYSERQRQLQGIIAQAERDRREAEKSRGIVGDFDFGNFDPMLEPMSSIDLDQHRSARRAAAKLAPEFSPNKRRDKPYMTNIRMHDTLGLDEPLIITGEWKYPDDMD
jgi:hypothetical protein